MTDSHGASNARGGMDPARPASPTSGAPVRGEERRLPEPAALRRLLVPLDGTVYAERALPFAAALASAAGAGITIASVRTGAPRRAEDPAASTVARLAQGRPDVALHDLPTYLDWVRRWFLPYVGDVAVVLLDARTALDGLLGFERCGESDLTVMATHARQRARRLLLGSVADGLVRAAHTPVLAIPPRVEPTHGRIPLLTRVIVPLDGSVMAEQALGPLLGWLGGPVPSELAPREVVLLAAEAAEQPAEEAARYLDDLCARLAPRLKAAVSGRVVVGAPAAAIVAATDAGLAGPAGERAPADLVAMATHGRGGLGRWLYGSVAGYVLSHARTPVLLVHPPQTDM